MIAVIFNLQFRDKKLFVLIDSHIHLYAEQYNSDREKLIGNADLKGVNAFVLPNIDSTSVNAMQLLAKSHPKKCFPCMGLHPCSVKSNYEEELYFVENNLFGDQKYYAVGELGIDMHWDTSTLDIQKRAMVKQMEWASEINLPIIIHSRKSTEIIIKLLKEHKDLNITGVFHCFSGTQYEAESIIELGFKLGVGGVITYKNSGLDKVLKEINMDNIILETDGPYLAPVPYRGKRNEPEYLKLVAAKLSDIKQLSVQQIELETTKNCIKLFNLPINENTKP